MKITNLGVSNTSLPSHPPVDGAAAAASEQSASSVTPDAKGYAPSAELRDLLDLTRAQPAVREDRVQAVLQRLQQGYYHTADSASQTADAMFHSLD